MMETATTQYGINVIVIVIILIIIVIININAISSRWCYNIRYRRRELIEVQMYTFLALALNGFEWSSLRVFCHSPGK
jgi:hypothetical protein